MMLLLSIIRDRQAAETVLCKIRALCRRGALALCLGALWFPPQASSFEQPETSGQNFTVIIQDDAPYFLPKRTQIASGTTVTWKNTGPSLIHTIMIRSADGAVTSGSITTGHAWTYRFAENQDAVVRTSCEL